MAEAILAQRSKADDGAPVTIGPIDAPAFSLMPVLPATRFVLRIGQPPADVAGFGLAMGLNRLTHTGDLLALRPGPDEFLLIAPDGSLSAATIAAALGQGWHSLVDISHRNIGLSLSGTRVTEVLNAGCPLDLHLSAFPVGMGTRTLLGKVEMILMRMHENRFRLECGRSFAPYVRDFLCEAAREWRV